MEVNRLNQEELSYELAIRGLPIGKVDDMRVSLRSALKAEKLGQSLFANPYPFKFEEDLEALEKKLEDINNLIATFDSDSESPEYKKIMTKVQWAFSRLGRSQTVSEAQLKEKSRMKGGLVLALGSLQEKAEGDTLESDESDRMGEPSMTQTVLSVPCPRVPVYKWGVTFSGEQGQSLNSFLERVTELGEARGVNKIQLFRSALDLFTGKALIWYRANKSKFQSWADLTAELKKEYLPADYDDRLLEEIKRRTQGKDESIGTYIAIMSSMFARLNEPLTQEQQLKILKRNLTPFYQSQLGLTDITGIQDLVNLGRRLESIRTSVETFVPPPNRRSTHLLEPDLAYAYIHSPNVATVSGNPNNQVSSRRGPRCFKCGRQGHIARFCRAPTQHTTGGSTSYNRDHYSSHNVHATNNTARNTPAQVNTASEN